MAPLVPPPHAPIHGMAMGAVVTNGMHRLPRLDPFLDSKPLSCVESRISVANDVSDEINRVGMLTIA